MHLLWFIKESKKYKGYGIDTSKIKFWLYFPIAYVKFLFYTYVKGGYSND